MKINTKFNIGDKVYTYNSIYDSDKGVLVEEKIPSTNPCTINGINIGVSNTAKVYVDYMLSNNEMRSEDELFPTKEAVKKFCNESVDY